MARVNLSFKVYVLRNECIECQRRLLNPVTIKSRWRYDCGVITEKQQHPIYVRETKPQAPCQTHCTAGKTRVSAFLRVVAGASALKQATKVGLALQLR